MDATFISVEIIKLNMASEGALAEDMLSDPAKIPRLTNRIMKYACINRVREKAGRIRMFFLKKKN